MLIPKPLAVGKIERYEVGVSSWLAGETLISATVVSDAKITIDSTDIVSPTIGFFATGVSIGRSEIKLNYATATRTECSTVYIDVLTC